MSRRSRRLPDDINRASEREEQERAAEYARRRNPNPINIGTLPTVPPLVRDPREFLIPPGLGLPPRTTPRPFVLPTPQPFVLPTPQPFVLPTPQPFVLPTPADPVEEEFVPISSEFVEPTEVPVEHAIDTGMYSGNLMPLQPGSGFDFSIPTPQAPPYEDVMRHQREVNRVEREQREREQHARSERRRLERQIAEVRAMDFNLTPIPAPAMTTRSTPIAPGDRAAMFDNLQNAVAGLRDLRTQSAVMRTALPGEEALGDESAILVNQRRQQAYDAVTDLAASLASRFSELRRAPSYYVNRDGSYTLASAPPDLDFEDNRRTLALLELSRRVFDNPNAASDVASRMGVGLITRSSEEESEDRFVRSVTGPSMEERVVRDLEQETRSRMRSGSAPSALLGYAGLPWSVNSGRPLPIPDTTTTAAPTTAVPTAAPTPAPDVPEPRPRPGPGPAPEPVGVEGGGGLLRTVGAALGVGSVGYGLANSQAAQNVLAASRAAYEGLWGNRSTGSETPSQNSSQAIVQSGIQPVDQPQAVVQVPPQVQDAAPQAPVAIVAQTPATPQPQVRPVLRDVARYGRDAAGGAAAAWGATPEELRKFLKERAAKFTNKANQPQALAPAPAPAPKPESRTTTAESANDLASSFPGAGGTPPVNFGPRGAGFPMININLQNIQTPPSQPSGVVAFKTLPKLRGYEPAYKKYALRTQKLNRELDRLAKAQVARSEQLRKRVTKLERDEELRLERDVAKNTQKLKKERKERVQHIRGDIGASYNKYLGGDMLQRRQNVDLGTEILKNLGII